MADMCVNGYGKECDGCGRCNEECADYSYDIAHFNSSAEEICNNIDNNLYSLKFLLEKYSDMEIDELEEDLKLVEKSLKLMRGGLNCIY